MLDALASTAQCAESVAVLLKHSFDDAIGVVLIWGSSSASASFCIALRMLWYASHPASPGPGRPVSGSNCLHGGSQVWVVLLIQPAIHDPAQIVELNRRAHRFKK